jgi:cobalamin biosynthesis Mg chelatase CobN
MAFKRTSKKTGPNSRRTTTYNTNGSTTQSNSVKSGSVTYTNTTKGGKSYTTQTVKGAGGYVSRKRIGSNSTKKSKTDDSAIGLIAVLVVVGFIVSYIGSIFGITF